MNFPVTRPRPSFRFAGMALLAAGLLAGPSVPAEAHASTRRQVVPLDKIAPEHREGVAEVIRDHTFHRQGPGKPSRATLEFTSVC